MTTSFETASAAKAFAAAGHRIFPIKARMKGAPLIKEWPTNATADLAQVAQWWPEGSQSNIGLVGGDGKLLLDIDWRKPGCREALAELEAKHGALPPTFTVTTPSGGEHRYFCGPDVPNSAGKIGAGLDIKSRDGYVVAPGSYTDAGENQSQGHYQVKDSLPMAPAPAWLIELAGAPKASTEAPAVKLCEATPAQLTDIRGALNHLATVPDVASNKLWSDIGYALLCLGDQGRDLWCEWSARAPGYGGAVTPEGWWDTHNADRARSDFRALFTIARELGWRNPNPAGDPSLLGFGKSPLPEGAVAATSVAPHVPVPRFPVVNAWDYADGPDPQWRVSQLLPEQGLAMIYGPSGVGKSFFVLDLVMAIALGKRYGYDQRQVTPGRVVYVVAEGAGGFRKRMRAYRVHHKLNANSPAPLLVPVAPNLVLVGDVIELQAAILAAGGADVVVIDTLHASSAGADENSAKDMGLYLGHCRALQAATGGLVILIHHSGKDEERGARGSSALRAAMDTEIEVSRGADDLAIARLTKQRDGDDFAMICFKLVSVLSTASAVVEHVARPAKVRKQRTSAEQALVLQQLQELAPTYPEGVQMNVLKAAINSVRPDMKLSNIERSITRAIDSGLLTIDSSQVVRLVRGGPALSGFGPKSDEAA